VASAGGVQVPGSAPGGPGEALLSMTEMNAARARRSSALAGLAERCRGVERDVAAYRTQALAGVPPGCEVDPGHLGEIVELTSTCAHTQSSEERAKCFQRRETLNQRVGACERQAVEHDQQRAAAERSVDAYRRRRVASLAAELEREAGSSRVSGSNSMSPPQPNTGES
jgi:hypothetical protein